MLIHILGIVFTNSRCGKPLVSIGGYRYKKNNRSKGTRSMWYCTKGRHAACKASVCMVGDQVEFFKNLHTHEPFD
ncbi:unnamed protein product [Colias eurytheme]|nr:unnamed protein product [Colias eurytheme]